jgi:ABC-type branched-subunit amino acid transport system substrate-binding protein
LNRSYYIIAVILFFSFFINSNAQNVKIGVALPLFEGTDDPAKKQLGNDILDGMKFSLSEFTKSTKIKVSLEVMDTQRDPKQAYDIIKGFGEDPAISCVLGPVFSSELLECAKLGEEYNLPIVSPTATGDNLASDHNYIFQLNPSYEVRGKLMAEYLIKRLGMKNFAVIYEENYGANFNKAFDENVKKLNGKVVSSNPYPKDITNIGEIIGNIYKVIKENDLFINPANLNLTQRQKLETAGVRYSLIDSLVSSKLDVSIYYLLGRNAKKMMDSMSIKPYKIKDDVNKFLQGYIDAIYIPISNASEISVIVPQLFSDGLSFFIAGTGDWNNEDALKDNKVYINNVIFESEYFPDSTSENYRQLKTGLKKSKYKLSKNFLFGYDAMNLILKQVEDGAKTRDQFNDALKKVLYFDAVKSKISLDYYGINSELNILHYGNGIERVETYKLTN